jgi:hypothetical protein
LNGLSVLWWRSIRLVQTFQALVDRQLTADREGVATFIVASRTWPGGSAFCTGLAKIWLCRFSQRQHFSVFFTTRQVARLDGQAKKSDGR